MLVLIGSQGRGKSTAIRTLSPNPAWFTDTTLDLRSKDAMEGILGKWLVEWQECHTLMSAPITLVKGFITSQVDHFRLPYDRRSGQHLRQAVFIGTTNVPEILGDSTGSRRFWPVRTGSHDLKRLEVDRDQIWAEAMVAFQRHEPWYLSDQEQAILAKRSMQYLRSDPWEGAVAEWAATQDGFTTNDVLTRLGIPAYRAGKAEEMRLASLLRHLGYDKVQHSENGVTARRWYPVGHPRLVGDHAL